MIIPYKISRFLKRYRVVVIGISVMLVLARAMQLLLPEHVVFAGGIIAIFALGVVARFYWMRPASALMPPLGSRERRLLLRVGFASLLLSFLWLGGAIVVAATYFPGANMNVVVPVIFLPFVAAFAMGGGALGLFFISPRL